MVSGLNKKKEHSSTNSENIIIFPKSIEFRFHELTLNGNLTDEALQLLFTDILRPLKLQAEHVLSTLKTEILASEPSYEQNE